MNEHAVEVVQLGDFRPHPNADNLALVDVFGYTVVVRNSEWGPGDLAAYVPPDSIVPNAPEYSFLDGHLRIRAKKLRGIISFGMLVPAPAGAAVGRNVAEQLGITHYEPPLSATTGGNDETCPPGFTDSTFDIENLRRYPGVIMDGTPVQVTEKIHGACGRFTWRADRLWAGSRNAWKKPDESCLWWRVVEAVPQIELFCRTHPGKVLYGEVFGQVQALKYGSPKGVRFAAFDASHGDGSFVSAKHASAMFDSCALPRAPLLAREMPYSFDSVAELAEGDSMVAGADHVREGCVVKPLDEMYSAQIGRVILKCIGGGYLLLKG